MAVTVPWKKSHCVYQKPIISSEKENRTILWAEEVVAYLKMGREESESEEGTEEAKARGLNLGQEGDGGQNPGRRGWEPSLGWHRIGPRSLTNGLRLRLARCPQAFRPTSLLTGLPRRGASGQLIHKKGMLFLYFTQSSLDTSRGQCFAFWMVSEKITRSQKTLHPSRHRGSKCQLACLWTGAWSILTRSWSAVPGSLEFLPSRPAAALRGTWNQKTWRGLKVEKGTYSGGVRSWDPKSIWQLVDRKWRSKAGWFPFHST